MARVGEVWRGLARFGEVWQIGFFFCWFIGNQIKKIDFSPFIH
jgi:hypothetical protein